jgi:hypothetical protein
MGMMNTMNPRGAIGMPPPSGQRWLGQPAGPRPAQVNEAAGMGQSPPMPQQLPTGPMPPQPPGVLGGGAGGGPGALPGLSQQAGMNPWMQGSPQRGVHPPMMNPMARMLMGG